MAFLAQRDSDTLVPAAAMDGKVSVPSNYRGRILHQLMHAGPLESTRGRTGGFRLARPASRIRLEDVVAPCEPRTENTCMLGRARCQDAHPRCRAHVRWREPRRTRDEFLGDTTVADVAS